MEAQKYKRVLIKISGEALAGDKHFGLNFDVIGPVCDVIKKCNEEGCEIGIVVGGGNFWRGVKDGGGKMERTRADHMGMLATTINALALQDALEQQKWQHQKAEWVEQLKKFATEDSQASYQTHEHVNAYGKWGTKKEVVMPEDADKIAYVYKVSENQIDLYKPRDTEAEDASNSAREAARATEQLAREQFAAVTKLMYELRWDFVKDLTPAECRKHLPEILAYSTPILTEYRHMEDDENVLRLLGIGLDEQIREDTELEDALKMFNAYDTEPEKILLAVAFDATDGIHEGYWSTEWNGPTGASKFVHRKNDDLDSTYELLTALGYEMADDEKALQDGTHQLFAVYGSGSKADTPCDKCKAAHPECDKCCKTCDDHCNAFQLCRKEYGE